MNDNSFFYYELKVKKIGIFYRRIIKLFYKSYWDTIDIGLWAFET